MEKQINTITKQICNVCILYNMYLLILSPLSVGTVYFASEQKTVLLVARVFLVNNRQLVLDERLMVSQLRTMVRL